jgi:hypothetical protein
VGEALCRGGDELEVALLMALNDCLLNFVRDRYLDSVSKDLKSELDVAEWATHTVQPETALFRHIQRSVVV